MQADILCNGRGLDFTTGAWETGHDQGRGTLMADEGDKCSTYSTSTSLVYNSEVPMLLNCKRFNEKNRIWLHQISKNKEESKKKRKLELKIVKWSHKHYPIKLNTTSKLPTSIPLLQDAHTTIKVLQHFAGCVNLTKGWSFDSRGYWQKAAAQAAVGSNFHSRLGLHKATCPHMSKYIWFR